MEKLNRKKITELPIAKSIDKLYTVGTDSNNQSVKVPIELLKGNKGDQGEKGKEGEPNNTTIFNISQYNNKFDYTDCTSARNDVPTSLRGLGQQITYQLSNGDWVSEQFIGANLDLWKNAENWKIVLSHKFLSDSIIGVQEYSIIKCIDNLIIQDLSGGEKYMILQQGYSSISNNNLFYFKRLSDNKVLIFEDTEQRSGIHQYNFSSGNITVSFSFNFDIFNKKFTTNYTPYIDSSRPELEHYLIILSEKIDSTRLYREVNFLPESKVSDKNVSIAKIIQKVEIEEYTQQAREWELYQQGWSDVIECPLFYFYSKDGTSSAEFQLTDIIERPNGIKAYQLDNGAIRVNIVFDWDLYNSVFNSTFPYTRDGVYIMSKPIGADVIPNFFSSKKILSSSVWSARNRNILNSIEHIELYTSKDKIVFNFAQMGFTSSNKLIFYFQSTVNTSSVVMFEFPEVAERQSGIVHYEKEITGYKLVVDFNWDVYNQHFIKDLYRPEGTTKYIKIQSKELVSNTTTNVTPTLGHVVSAKKGKRNLLVGASFASPLNGWFELACNKLDLVCTNKAIGGQTIFNNVAQRMLDANESQPHGSLFMVEGVDIFKDVEVFTLMMTHNYNVFLDEVLFKQYDLDYYKANGVGSNHAMAWDYIIKQYKQWCAEYTISNSISAGGSTYPDVAGTKECNIFICSHWLPSRTTFNDSSKKLAKRFNLVYCDFANNIGISNTDTIYTTTNTDAQPIPTLDHYNPSVLHAQFSEANSTRAIGKTEIIDGVTWGWHPQQRSKTFDFGNGKDVDDYYYPNIQYMLSGIYKKHIEVV